MKKLFLGISIIFLIQTLSVAENAWKQRADFPGDGRSAVSSFGFSDFGFVGLGYDGEDFRRSFYAYNPETNTWFQTESLGGAIGEGMERNVAAAFTIGNKGYIGTGQGNDPFLNDFWEYNYNTNVWTPKPSVGGVDRRSGVGFTVSGKGYIGLGQDAGGFKKDFWQFDTLTNAWTQKADYGGTARRFAVAFVIGARVFVGTGDDGVFKNDFYEYNAPANAWFPKNNFGGSARYGATGFALNGKGYIACGYDTTLTNRNDFWEYDPDADTWEQMPDFPGGNRTNLTSFVIDTQAYVGMGYDTSFNYDIWLWGDTTEVIFEDTTHNAIFTNTYITQNDISIFPNPVTNFATIIIQSEIDLRKIKYHVYDLQGKDMSALCKQISSQYVESGTEIKLTFADLPKGVYQFVIREENYSAVKKFIVI